MFSKIKKNAMRIPLLGLFLLTGSVFYACQEQEAEVEITDTTKEDNYAFNKVIKVTDPAGQYSANVKIESNNEEMLFNYMETTTIGLGIIYKENDPFTKDFVQIEELNGIETKESYSDGISVTALEISLPDEALGYFLDVRKTVPKQSNRVAYDHYITYNGGEDRHYGKVEYDDIQLPEAVVYVHWQYRNSKLLNWKNWNVTEILTQQNTLFSVYYSGKYLKAICESDFQNHKVYWKKNEGDTWSGPDTPQ